MRRPLWIALLVAAPFFPAVARADDFEAAELRADLVGSLEELTHWARSKRLYGKRDDTYALILEVDPEHVGARHALDYERAEDGTWVQNPRFKRGTNWSRRELENYDRRLAEILERHGAALLAVADEAVSADALAQAVKEIEAALALGTDCEAVLQGLRRTMLRYAEALRPDGSFEARIAARRALLDRFPDDEEVRRTVGDVLREGVWMPKDAAVARDRQAELAAAAEAAKQASLHSKGGELKPE
ncbi:MAG: hypothetical protein ACYTG6_03795, partial [Planctomycetota bacterium]